MLVTRRKISRWVEGGPGSARYFVPCPRSDSTFYCTLVISQASLIVVSSLQTDTWHPIYSQRHQPPHHHTHTHTRDARPLYNTVQYYNINTSQHIVIGDRGQSFCGGPVCLLVFFQHYSPPVLIFFNWSSFAIHRADRRTHRRVEIINENHENHTFRPRPFAVATLSATTSSWSTASEQSKSTPSCINSPAFQLRLRGHHAAHGLWSWVSYGGEKLSHTTSARSLTGPTRSWEAYRS